MTGTSPLSDVDLDRLVDGEMSDGERRDTLMLLESDSEGDDWRRCALAFLEAQAWSHVLGQDRERNAARCLTTQAVGPPNSSRGKAGRTNVDNRGRMSWPAWLTVAAAIMIAFGMGIASERLPHRFDDPMWLASDANPPVDPVPSAEKPTPDSSGGLSLVVHDDTGESQQVDVPIVDWDAGEKWLAAGNVSPLEEEIRNRLRRGGKNIGRREQYFAPIETHDGRRFIVPIQRWDVVPASAHDYQ